MRNKLYNILVILIQRVCVHDAPLKMRENRALHYFCGACGKKLNWTEYLHYKDKLEAKSNDSSQHI